MKPNCFCAECKSYLPHIIGSRDQVDEGVRLAYLHAAYVWGFIPLHPRVEERWKKLGDKS